MNLYCHTLQNIPIYADYITIKRKNPLQFLRLFQLTFCAFLWYHNNHRRQAESEWGSTKGGMKDEVLSDSAGKGGRIMPGFFSVLTAAKIGSAIMNGICGIGTVVNVISIIRDILDD